MQTFSRDGKFVIAMPLKTEENGNKKVTITAREGKEVTLCDVAQTIRFECFSLGEDGKGIPIDIHLVVEKREYDFTVEWWPTPDSYLLEIVEQFKL